MGFPSLGKTVLGAGDPQNVNFSIFSPKRHVYQRNHVVWSIVHSRRKLRLAYGLVREKRVGENKVTKVCQTAIVWGRHRSMYPQICLPIECTPQRGHPCQFWFWSVNAFSFHRGSKFPCFLHLAERPIQQCFALPCSAVISNNRTAYSGSQTLGDEAQNRLKYAIL